MSPGTATAGADYTAVPAGTVTFTAGTTEQTVSVPILDDEVHEPDETRDDADDRGRFDGEHGDGDADGGRQRCRRAGQDGDGVGFGDGRPGDVDAGVPGLTITDDEGAPEKRPGVRTRRTVFGTWTAPPSTAETVQIGTPKTCPGTRADREKSGPSGPTGQLRGVKRVLGSRNDTIRGPSNQEKGQFFRTGQGQNQWRRDPLGPSTRGTQTFQQQLFVFNDFRQVGPQWPSTGAARKWPRSGSLEGRCGRAGVASRTMGHTGPRYHKRGPGKKTGRGGERPQDPGRSPNVFPCGKAQNRASVALRKKGALRPPIRYIRWPYWPYVLGP